MASGAPATSPADPALVPLANLDLGLVKVFCSPKRRQV